MGVCVPDEYGGAGADFLSYILVLEELSRGDAGVGVTVAVHTSACTLPLLQFGTDEQRARFVPPLARGERVGCFALTESGSGSDAGALVTRAERSDARLADHRREAVDHERRRSAARSCCSRAPTVRRAAARGVSAFVLDTEQVTITRTEEKLGLNSSATNDIAIDSVVDADRLLGELHHGFRIAMATLDGGRIGIAAQAVGIAQAAFDVALRYAQERRAFGQRIARLPGDPAQAREHVDGDRRGPAARLPRRVAEGPGPAAHRGGREGEAVRVRDGAPPDRRGDPGARRLRLHEGVPGRALLPRRESDGDLRRHERDPAPRDRRAQTSDERQPVAT